MHFIQKIKQRLSEPLPSVEVQRQMAPPLRGRETTWAKDPRVACVLVLLYPKASDWYFALIQRKSQKNDRHSGQISFPGGKYEESDLNLANCALRETEEEIGIPQSNVTLIGELSEMYIPVSNFKVHPFVGYLEEQPVFIPQPSEVQEILEVPISELGNVANQKVKDLRVRENLILKNTPYFDLEGRVVWGATAMMLNEFRGIVFRE